MPEDEKFRSPAVKVSAGPHDLSDEIARAVRKAPREQVTCRRITSNHYRCNWWAAENVAGYDNPGMSGMLVTTSKICRSQFLHVVKEGTDLQITVLGSDKVPVAAKE